MNADAELAPVSEGKAVVSKMDDDFSAQVIKENNLLKAQTSKKYQRNEPIIESGSAHTDQREAAQPPLQPFGSAMVQPRFDNNQSQQPMGPPYNLHQAAAAPLQGNHHQASLSTISIQDQQRQSLQADRSPRYPQRAEGPMPTNAAQISFQNSAVQY